MASGPTTKDEKDLLAAEYVLGTLDPEERRRVRKALSRDLALQDAVERWQRRLASLAQAAVAEEPPALVWDRIEAAIGEETAEPFSLSVRASEGEWKPHAEGIEKKSLYVNREEGFEAFLLRFAPGAVLAPHPHRMTEECIVLEGDVEIGGLRLTGGRLPRHLRRHAASGDFQ